MNGPLTSAVADAVQTRADLKAITSVTDRIRRLYEIPVPTPAAKSVDEAQLAAEYLGEQPTSDVWSQFTQALLLTNEFMFVDLSGSDFDARRCQTGSLISLPTSTRQDSSDQKLNADQQLQDWQKHQHQRSWISVSS